VERAGCKVSYKNLLSMKRFLEASRTPQQHSERGACLQSWQVYHGHKPVDCLLPIKIWRAVILISLCSHWRERFMLPGGKMDVQLFRRVVQPMVLTVEFSGCLG